MQIKSIEQELIEGTEMILTRVTLNQVNSSCILSRLIIDTLGKPGIDNDLQLLGSGSQWEVVWTEPKLTIEQTREIISKAISFAGTA
ncbi:conserved hypothetical protein [Hyella patelloides LEGE 07179]|uniref:Uncharacterized protein n=1 Tax=Hyella patelloides LEGE 07179 TaxID=945734 RepID=A0A563VV38_9CYAN|nr:hypothetical protein [Hyella patelloides]VEP15275.1 conserved hypothetical protein [Hyella patelloides LEGE 07179]